MSGSRWPAGARSVDDVAMAPIGSYAASAATWQNFYLLVGAGAATLIGLMFVALTFGASLVTKESVTAARAFVDPTLNHFVQVLLTACFVTIPTMGETLLGILVAGIGVFRILWLVKIFRHMREAHRANGDMDASDWLSGVVVPFATYALLIATGAGFVQGYAASFNGLAIATILALLNGILSAWELMVWMALARNVTKADGDTPKNGA
jgi:hypothetical protein